MAQIYLNKLYRNAERKDLIRHMSLATYATLPQGGRFRLALRQERTTEGRPYCRTINFVGAIHESPAKNLAKIKRAIHESPLRRIMTVVGIYR